MVGYYGPIADELATRATEALYASIAGGEPTRRAVAQARAALLRAFEGEGRHWPVAKPSPARDTGAAPNVTHPFAWAQLVFYHRGPEHALGTAASEEQLRRREAALKRTYRQWEERAFLATGFIGRRRELHQLRRRRRRGERVFVLQGLGGLGKTTLAGQLLPTLADPQHTVALWCRRTEGKHDPAEALVGQLLRYARDRFGTSFEQVVSSVDRDVGDDSVQRFTRFLQELLVQQQGAPLAVYLDNLESLLHGPDDVSLDTAPDPDAFGTWRSAELRGTWQALTTMAGAVEHLYVVASCRYRHADLAPALVPVSPLGDADLFRLMAWFPALRRLSARTRARLVERLAGHPRAVEFLDDLMAAALREWEERRGAWRAPAWGDAAALDREWEQLVAPALPVVDERIWSDLLLAALWERVLDERARRMLFRMTLPRRPWQDDLTPHLGESDENAEAARRTARALQGTSLLERVNVIVETDAGREHRPHFTLHASTAAFVKSRFQKAGELKRETHRRIGTHLEQQIRMPHDLNVDLEAGHHLFAAGEYDRAYESVQSAADLLRHMGRVRESRQVLVPFLADAVERRMTKDHVGRLLGTIGHAHFELGDAGQAIRQFEQALDLFREVGNRLCEGRALSGLGRAHGAIGEGRRTVEYAERALLIAREIGDKEGEGDALGTLGNASLVLGETRRAIELYEQQLVMANARGDRRDAGRACGSLGRAYAALGDTRRAIGLYEQRLAIAHEVGDQRGRSTALGNLGSSYLTLGEIGRAISYCEQQLAVARQIGDRRGEGHALGNLGSAYLLVGDATHAIKYYEQRLVLARKIGDKRGEGTTLSNLGNACASLGETRRAVEHFKEGLAIGRATCDPSIIQVCEQGLKRSRGRVSD